MFALHSAAIVLSTGGHEGGREDPMPTSQELALVIFAARVGEEKAFTPYIKLTIEVNGLM